VTGPASGALAGEIEQTLREHGTLERAVQDKARKQLVW
jgi:hypothetical protein